MKDVMGRPLHNGDLVIYAPHNSYSMRMAIIVDSTKGEILSGRLREDGNISINIRTGEALGSRLFIVASWEETKDYESINDDFREALEQMGRKI